MSETLSIVIVNWNSREHLRRCLETIQETCSDLSPKVIVVDGASFDGCAEMLEREFPAVSFMQSPHNIGFGRCNNLGFSKVGTDAVLLLNPDTELRPGAVARLLQVLKQTPNAGIVSPRLLNSDGSLQASCVQSLPTPLNQALDCDFLREKFAKSRLWGTYAAFHSNVPLEVEVLSGACMALQSETFQKLGGFREEFFMYGEDVDLCFRARGAGLKNIFVPDAEVVHHGGGSSLSQVSGFSSVMLRVAGEIYFRLNHGKMAGARYLFLQGISALFRLALLSIPIVFCSGERRVRALASAEKWITILKWAMGNRPSIPGQSVQPAPSSASEETLAFTKQPVQTK